MEASEQAQPIAVLIIGRHEVFPRMSTADGRIPKDWPSVSYVISNMSFILLATYKRSMVHCITIHFWP